MFSQRALLRCTAQQSFAAPRVAARGYAAAAANTKPPVALFGIDGTYANALVGLLFGSWSCALGGRRDVEGCHQSTLGSLDQDVEISAVDLWAQERATSYGSHHSPTRH